MKTPHSVLHSSEKSSTDKIKKTINYDNVSGIVSYFSSINSGYLRLKYAKITRHRCVDR